MRDGPKSLYCLSYTAVLVYFLPAILRHENVSTTQKFYIKTARQDVKDAMKQLERKIQSAAVVQQVTVN
jgi:hypothetical protein